MTYKMNSYGNIQNNSTGTWSDIGDWNTLLVQDLLLIQKEFGNLLGVDEAEQLINLIRAKQE